MSTDIHYLTLADAAQLIRKRELSPVELTRVYLERIEAFDPALHAFITVLTDSAIESARKAEIEIRNRNYRGPLHGIPIAHKDILWTKGVRTTAHSRLLETWVPNESATVVEMLEKAGAICIGKTSLHEFAYGSPGPDEAFPAARNPWNLDYAPGSSSSGSAVAVAAGLCMAATGTDTGGSVRHPASACGVVGIKGTTGLVSNYGVIPLAPSLDHVGALTRTVMDNALMFQLMAGYDPRDSGSIQCAVPELTRLIGRELNGMRIGVPRRFIDAHPHSPEVIVAFEKSLVALKNLGAIIEEIDPLGINDCIDAVNAIIGYESFLYHRRNLERHPELLGQAFKGRFERIYSEEDYKRALQTREKLRAVYVELFSNGISAVVSPGKEVPADLMSDLLAAPSKRPVSNRIYSLIGLPALTMPMALSEGRLPMGIQIASAAFREDIIYQVASAFESTTGFGKLHPPTA